MATKTIVYGNATIKLYRPTLTEEEQKKRENRIALALQNCAQHRKENEHETQRRNHFFIETDRQNRN